MKTHCPKAILFTAFALAGLMPFSTASAADAPITHQITLPAEQTWCSDSMINGLLNEINAFRVKNQVGALTASALGMKDAELRASQFATYMLTTPPGSPGFFPHQGYDTTAASLGYNLISENLAFISTDPVYIVEGIWQDSLHLAALLAPDATVMGVSCVYDSGTAYWTYEPGTCSGTSCATSPATTPTPTPTGVPTLDSEEWSFLTLINNYRAQNGLGPLQVSVELETAAKWMSADMAAKNYFSHTDSLGRSTGTRLAAFGYTYSPWGENLAAGYSAAQDAFNGWQNACDPDATGACTYAHRKNMLTPGFTAIGISRAYGSSAAYGWYWTTDFGGYVEQAITPSGSAPAPTAPAIASFTANPPTLTAGGSATLSWTVTGATSITIDNGIGDVSTAASKVVTPAQTTTYTLTAVNSTGTSVAKTTVTVTAPAGDTHPPSTPTLLSAAAKSSTEVDLSWTASTDDVGVRGYQVLRSGAPLASVSGTTTSYADLSVSGGAGYTYSVRAFDAAGNYSPASNTILVFTPAPAASSTNCPAPVISAFTACYYSNTTLSGSPTLVRTDAQVNFDWGANTPDRAVSRGSFSVRWQGQFSFAQGPYTFTAVTSDGMRLYIDGVLVLDRWFDQPSTQYSVQRQMSSGQHLITVEYYESTGWSVAHLTWQVGGTAAPAPSILSFAATPSVVNAGQPATLTWSVNGATSLKIDNGVGDVTGTTLKSVTPSQSTTYTLTASNSSGAVTSHVTVTVNTFVDTLAPTAPALLSVTAPASNQVKLAWSASADNTGVAGYQVLRNGSAIGSTGGSTLSYTDASATPGTAYTYTVKAFDGAGNYSPASNATAVTTPPSAVSGDSCPGNAVNAFTGCYYSNTDLTGAPALLRSDPQINFDWAGNPPDRSIGRSGFSVRWKGTFSFADGTYTFSTLTSDGVRLYVDGKLLLDHWNDQTATQYSVQQYLQAGTHSIVMEYYESTGWSSAHLSWVKN